MNSILQEIKEFADKAHGEQMRKYTADRYIVHPMRVMEICQEYTHDIAMLAAAILHDVLEDTPVTEKELHDFLSTLLDHDTTNRTVKLVVELTDQYIKEKYPQWNRSKRKAKERERMANVSGEAQTIKYADIIDNTMEIVYQDREFAPLYLEECKQLLKGMRKGDIILYARAIATVDDGLKKLGKK